MKKKLLLIFIVAIVLILSFGLISCNFKSAEEPTDVEPEPEPRLDKIAVLSDIHLVSEDELDSQEEFDRYIKNDNKSSEFSIAAFLTVQDEIIARGDIKTVLITGDLTYQSHAYEHALAEKYLRRFTDAGLKVFVINGNHDLYYDYSDTIQLGDFKELYAPYGYNSAISVHEDSASYSADIMGNVRLIALDNDSYYIDRKNDIYNEYPSETIHTWLEQELIRAQTDGKQVIVMYHKPYHPQFISALHSGVGEYCDELNELFAKYGVSVTLCGHNHGQLISDYTTASGTTYEVMTASTIAISACYRTLDFFDSTVQIESHPIAKLNESYISEFCPADILAQVTTDYTAYTKNKSGNYFVKHISSYTRSYLGKLPAVCDAIFNVYDLNIYSSEGEPSLESLVMSYGGSPLPSTGFKTMRDLVPFILSALFEGDQTISYESPESQIIKQFVFAVIFYLEPEINKHLPENSQISIDFDALFSTGKLEAISSGFINGVVQYIGSLNIINFDFSKINFSSLVAFTNLAPALDTLILPELELFTSLAPYITENTFDMDGIVTNVIFAKLLGTLYSESEISDNSATLPL